MNAPSRAECLEYALDTNQDSGIWGGLSEEERRVIRRQRRGRHVAAQPVNTSSFG